MRCNPMPLLFPVIAWYDIIIPCMKSWNVWLLFPVIAWYDIISLHHVGASSLLLFPVIAWYDIITVRNGRVRMSCCSQLSLGMI